MLTHSIFRSTCVLAVFLAAITTDLRADDEPSCALQVGEAKGGPEHISCLEQRLGRLASLVELYRERDQKLREEMQSFIEKQVKLEIYGPPKTIEEIKAGIYRTRSRWGNRGDAHQDWSCLPPAVEKPGMVVVGAQDLGMKVERGCQGAGHCDSTGEWCESWSRTAGCYVSKQWYDWYMARAAALRLPTGIDVLCAK